MSSIYWESEIPKSFLSFIRWFYILKTLIYFKLGLRMDVAELQTAFFIKAFLCFTKTYFGFLKVTCSKSLGMNSSCNWPKYNNNCPHLNPRAMDGKIGEIYTDFQTRMAMWWNGELVGPSQSEVRSESLLYIYRSYKKLKKQDGKYDFAYGRQGRHNCLQSSVCRKVWIWILVWAKRFLGMLPTLSSSQFISG